MEIPHTFPEHLMGMLVLEGDPPLSVVEDDGYPRKGERPDPPGSLPTDIPNLPSNAQLLGGSELFYLADFFDNLQRPPPAALAPTRTSLGLKRPLDEQERKSRHVASEHKRRDRIKEEMERMVRLVPATRQAFGTGRKSQARILAAANDYLSELQGENDRLRKMLVGRH